MSDSDASQALLKSEAYSAAGGGDYAATTGAVGGRVPTEAFEYMVTDCCGNQCVESAVGWNRGRREVRAGDAERLKGLCDAVFRRSARASGHRRRTGGAGREGEGGGKGCERRTKGGGGEIRVRSWRVEAATHP
jgi:hypothetical protein